MVVSRTLHSRGLTFTNMHAYRYDMHVCVAYIVVLVLILFVWAWHMKRCPVEPPLGTTFWPLLRGCFVHKLLDLGVISQLAFIQG